MVKITGNQTIPAEWNEQYAGTLTLVLPDGTIRKRYPFHVKLKQEGGYKVSAKQKAQRERFKDGKDQFRETGSAERTRWWNAMPQWKSVLWYYNYFMMSAISGVLGAMPQGAMVIKGIQNFVVTCGNTQNIITIPTAIDPEKAIVFIFGAGHDANWATSGTVFDYYAWKRTPAWWGLNSSRMTMIMENDIDADAIMTTQIIEYI